MDGHWRTNLEIAGGVGGRRELAKGHEARDEIRVELQRAALTFPKSLQGALQPLAGRAR